MLNRMADTIAKEIPATHRARVEVEAGLFTDRNRRKALGRVWFGEAVGRADRRSGKLEKHKRPLMSAFIGERKLGRLGQKDADSCRPAVHSASPIRGGGVLRFEEKCQDRDSDNRDDADDQEKQAQRPLYIVGRKCVEHQDKPDHDEN